MILIIIVAFCILMPLALWHDWIDGYEARNPQEGQQLRTAVAWIVGIGLGIWLFSNMTFY